MMKVFKEISEKIKSAKNVLIFTHINPDGDAVGSAFALSEAINGMEKRADVIFDSPLSSVYTVLGSRYVTPETVNDCYDLKISVDCSDMKRLGKCGEFFKGNTIVIDHHGTNQRFGELNYINAESPSTGEIIYELLSYMEAEITPGIATALYGAMMTDTGGFMHSNTTPETHIRAAELMKLGAEYVLVNRKLMQEKSYEGHLLNSYCVQKMSFYFGGRLCISVFDNAFCKEKNLDNEKISGLSGVPVSVEGAEAGIFISETEKGKVKVSLRSASECNVDGIAESFGGGGHKKAAGFLIENSSAEEIMLKLIKCFEKMWG